MGNEKENMEEQAVEETKERAMVEVLPKSAHYHVKHLFDDPRKVRLLSNLKL